MLIGVREEKKKKRAGEERGEWYLYSCHSYPPDARHIFFLAWIVLKCKWSMMMSNVVVVDDDVSCPATPLSASSLAIYSLCIWRWGGWWRWWRCGAEENMSPNCAHKSLKRAPMATDDNHEWLFTLNLRLSINSQEEICPQNSNDRRREGEGERERERIR